MTLRSWSSCLGLGILLAVAGCSPPDREKVAARVNGTSILADEVELALRQGGESDGDPAARRRLVERFVVEELLAQQFLRGIRDSAAVEQLAVNTARREALARRYVADLVERVEPPSDAAIRAFYRDNPAMFAERRIFALRELDIAAPADRDAELRERVHAATSLDEVAQWLRAEDLRFTASEAERSSDEFSRETLGQLTAMADGQVIVNTTANGLRVVQVVTSTDAPLGEQEAWPLIEQRLWMETRTAAVDAEIRRLSRLAAISIPPRIPGGEAEAFAASPGGHLPFMPDFSRGEQ